MAIKIRTKAELIALREGLHHYFGPELGLPDASYYDDVWSDSHGILKWKGRESYLEDLAIVTKYKFDPKKLDRKILNEADMALINLEAEAQEAVEFKGAPEREAAANIPPKDMLEQMEKQGKITADEKNRLKILSDQQIQQAIDQKIKLVNEQNAIKLQKEQAVALQKDLAGKKIYVKVQPQVPLKEAPPELKGLQEQAQYSPTRFVETATREYSQRLEGKKLDPIERELIARRAALTTQQVLTQRAGFIEAAKTQAIMHPEVLEKIISSQVSSSTVENIEETKPAEQTVTSAKQEPGGEKRELKKDTIVIESSSKTPSEAAPPEEVVSRGFTPLSIPRYADSTAKSAAKPSAPEDAFTKAIQKQDILHQIARNRYSMQMSQLELYKQFVNPAKLEGVDSLSQLKVEVLANPVSREEALKAGYEEIDISQDVIAPHIETLNDRGRVLDELNVPLEITELNVKQKLLLKAGDKLTAEIAKLPADSTLSQAFNSEIAQVGLARMGLITPPSSWIAAEGSWSGNLIISSGYGDVGGLFQKLTGADLGLVEISAGVGAGYISYAYAGAYYTTTSLSIGYTGGIMASEAFLGGAGAAMGAGAPLVGMGAGSVAGVEIASAATYTASSFAGYGFAVGTETIAGAAVGAAGAATTATAAAAGATVATTAAAGATVATATATGAAAGTAIPIPGVGTLIGAVTGALIALGPKIKSFLQNNSGKLLAGGLAVAAVGFGGGSAALLGLGAVSSLAGGAAFISAGTGFAGMASFMGGLLSTLFVSAVVVSGTAIMSFLFIVPIVVVFILIIINSGAYVVPPSLSTLSTVNPYISVSKTANPSGQVSSVQPVTYTITITATKDELTGISFTSTCQAVKKNGPTVDCSSLEQLPAPPATIPSGSSYSFSFTSNYPASYLDSLVTDTVTVTANTASAGSISETATASICFGNCPLDCFNFPAQYWPSNSDAQNLKNLLTGAAGRLASGYPSFAQKVCAQGTVNLCYNPGAVPGAGIFAFHNHNSSCDISFNSKVIPYGAEGAMFLLTHEATHHVQRISSGYVTAYEDFVGRPVGVCSYGGNDVYESMAESTALYVAKPTLDANGACITNFASQYPRHFEFAKNCMFGNNCP